MRAGRSFDFGGAHIEVLAPVVDYQPADVGKNNDSLVMRISYGKHSFLLTGDMEKQTEAELWSEGKLQHCDVLKVASPWEQDFQFRSIFGCCAAGVRHYLRRV